MNEVINKIQLLIDFGIGKDEKLTNNERINRMAMFRKSLSINKYLPLFQEVEDVLYNSDLDNKDKLLNKFYELIKAFSIFEDNINLFPIGIQKLFYSCDTFKGKKILFEQIENIDIFSPVQFEIFLNDYLNYLKDVDNQDYIIICEKEIMELDKEIDSYLKRKHNNVSYKKLINNQDLYTEYLSLRKNTLKR